MAPPSPERRPERLEAHGDVRIDDWYWLRDKDDPAVISHLEAENAYTEAAMAGTAGLRQEPCSTRWWPGSRRRTCRCRSEGSLALLRPYRRGQQLRDPLPAADRRVGGGRGPERAGGGEVGDGVGSGSGAPEGIPADEEVLLDENELAEGHEYFAVGNLEVSPDHRWLAYSTDTTGGERYTMRFVDLEGRRVSPEALEDTSYGVAWANDNATVFYVRVDEAMRPYQLWRHRVGSDPAADTLVYEEADDRFYLGVGRTKDDRYVLLGLHSKVTSECHALPADEPEGRFRVIEPRRQGIEYSVDHDRGDPATGRAERFLVVTNDGAEDFRLMEAPDDVTGAGLLARGHPGPARACGSTPSIPSPATWWSTSGRVARPGSRVDRRRRRGRSRAPGPSRSRRPRSWGGANPEYESTSLRYEYTSLVTPRSVYDLDLDSGASTLRKRQPVLGHFDPGRYRHRTPLGRGRRRDRGPHLAGLPARPGRGPRAHPSGTVSPLRVRLLRGVASTPPSRRCD